jgi:Na+-transporting NADH:ubiquinone oxidoreductase subunit NqrC
LVSLVTLIAFWRKKETQRAPEPERIIPLPKLPASTLETPRSTTIEAVNQAREALKILKLERQILGSAVTTIYESQTNGVISEAERDRMLEKYKVDLKRLEKAIDENQRVVDLYDLEVEKEELTKSYREKLAEIEARLKDLKTGGSTRTQNPVQQERAAEKKGNSNEGGRSQSSQEQPAKQEEEEQISDSEKRIEQIREEILKAMDRLEQIEAEG